MAQEDSSGIREPGLARCWAARSGCCFRRGSWQATLRFLAASSWDAFWSRTSRGGLLWRHRDRVPPYVAIQCVLGLIGVFGFGALVAMKRAGQLLTLDPRFASPAVYDGILPMVLGIMGWFWVVERAAIKKRSGEP